VDSDVADSDIETRKDPFFLSFPFIFSFIHVEIHVSILQFLKKNLKLFSYLVGPFSCFYWRYFSSYHKYVEG
jgi:hypothetical protein